MVITSVNEYLVYKTKHLNFLYIVYLVQGGIFFESIKDLKLKYFLIFMNIFVFCAHTIPSGYYLYQLLKVRETYKISQLIDGVGFFNGSLCVHFVYFITYCYKDNLKLIFKIMDDDCNIEWKLMEQSKNKDTNGEDKKVNIEQWINSIIKMFIVSIIMMNLSRFINALMDMGTEEDPNKFFYVVTYPYVENHYSLPYFLVIFIFQTLGGIYPCVTALFLPLLTFCICAYFHNAFITLINSLNYITESFKESMESRRTQFIDDLQFSSNFVSEIESSKKPLSSTYMDMIVRGLAIYRKLCR